MLLFFIILFSYCEQKNAFESGHLISKKYVQEDEYFFHANYVKHGLINFSMGVMLTIEISRRHATN